MKPVKKHKKVTKPEKLQRKIDVQNKKIVRLTTEKNALNRKAVKLQDAVTKIGIEIVRQNDLRDKLITSTELSYCSG